MFAHAATTPKHPAFPQEKRARFCLFIKSCSYLFAAWFCYWAQGLKCKAGTGMALHWSPKCVPGDSAQGRGSSTAWAHLQQDLLQAGFGHPPVTGRKLGLRHWGPETSCLTWWMWSVSLKKKLSAAGCINVNNTQDWSGGQFKVCTYLAAFSEEPCWLQGFRERRKPRKPTSRNYSLYSLLHTPEGTLRLRKYSCCPFLPLLLSVSPCPLSGWTSPSVFSRWGSTFSSYNREGKMQEKLTFPGCTGNCPGGVPCEMEMLQGSFASEMSQTRPAFHQQLLVPCSGVRQWGRWRTGQWVSSRNSPGLHVQELSWFSCGHCSALCFLNHCRSQKHTALSHSLSPILF